MSPLIQTNKEFVDSAGITEHDAFLAVAVRRIVARMLEIPAQKLTAQMTYETMFRHAGFYTDWDELCFLMELEELYNIDIDCEKVWEAAEVAGYSNWFYRPGVATFGEWVKLAVEIALAPIRGQIAPSADWPGLEASDLESDTVAGKSLVHDGLFAMTWGCMGLAVIVVGVIILRWCRLL